MQQQLAFLLLPYSSAVGMQIRLSFSIAGLHLGLLGKLLVTIGDLVVYVCRGKGQNGLSTKIQ